MPKLQTAGRGEREGVAEAEKQKSADFLAKAAQEPGAVKTPSGLVFKTRQPGHRREPEADGRRAGATTAAR